MFYTKVIVLILLVVLFYFSEKLVRKKLNIPRQNGFIYEHVNHVHKWGERIILLTYLVVSFICIFSFNDINLAYLIWSYFFVLCLFRAWMEWKYERESKEYFISIGTLIVFVITVILLNFLF
ncbi:DUF4181 domain-containing protein [Bacillus sp. DX4.1]|uniref:DUF4181 domain-containing protein n=1 Tax=Bacillus sp. DX4.1 TaxID=3055867 RepID=UPI0025A09B16|nr:DUF4181 domain-containing protein [Bacillus sp. DX4.1]MDM5188681.1 DUF4181 domain-containing protein [Bacillus sp. DX4.1]